MSSLPPEPTRPDDSADPAAEFLLAEAQKRLRAALEGLDHALGRHNQLVFEQADEVAEYAALQEDRSRLAQELDAAEGRARLLEAANLEALLRIERARAAVRAVIAADLGADPDPNPDPNPEPNPDTNPGADSDADPAREG